MTALQQIKSAQGELNDIKIQIETVLKRLEHAVFALEEMPTVTQTKEGKACSSEEMFLIDRLVDCNGRDDVVSAWHSIRKSLILYMPTQAKEMTCTACHGVGEGAPDSFSNPVVCGYCNGTGKLSTNDALDINDKIPCTQCAGTGKMLEGK